MGCDTVGGAGVGGRPPRRGPLRRGLGGRARARAATAGLGRPPATAGAATETGRERAAGWGHKRRLPAN